MDKPHVVLIHWASLPLVRERGIIVTRARKDFGVSPAHVILGKLVNFSDLHFFICEIIRVAKMYQALTVYEMLF